MNDSDYPYIFSDSDKTSHVYQNLFYAIMVAIILSSIAYALFQSFIADEKILAIAQMSCFICSLIASIGLALLEPQKIWYGTRAFAESIKTMTWRYMMKAPPFSSSRDQAVTELADGIVQLLRSNKSASHLNFVSAHRDPITKKWMPCVTLILLIA